MGNWEIWSSKLSAEVGYLPCPLSFTLSRKMSCWGETQLLIRKIPFESMCFLFASTFSASSDSRTFPQKRTF